LVKDLILISTNRRDTNNMNYDENPISIDVEIENKDNRKFSFFVILKRKTWLFLLPALFSLVYSLIVGVKKMMLVEVDSTVVIYNLIATLILIFILTISCTLITKKMYKNKKPVHIIGTYIFKNNSIEVKQQTQGTVGQFTLSYSVFTKIYESKDAFYLMTNVNQGHIIPKRYLSDLIQNQLTELLQTKVKGF
jgi:hypothetical protein